MREEISRPVKPHPLKPLRDNPAGPAQANLSAWGAFGLVENRFVELVRQLVDPGKRVLATER